MGAFVLLITALAFIAGWIREELALTLLGTIFLTALAYCFLGVFILGVAHRRKARRLSLIISPETVRAGKEGGLGIKTGGNPPAKNSFFRLPAIFVRCELRLETGDGRVIRHYADPGVENYSGFPVRERGVYCSSPRARDAFVVFDAPGFFRLSLPLPLNAGPRLFAVPGPAGELIRLPLRSGGTEQRNEPHYRKSDELTDHRPYIPGDDPRRINWKLYSHIPQGDLFVREGEPEPPPHSRLLIFIDTEADRALYTVDEGRRAVDLLCESALAAALEFSEQGMDVLIGCAGRGIAGGGEAESAEGRGAFPENAPPRENGAPLNAAELASALAWPFAVPWPCPPSADLPEAPGDRAVLVFSLPRTSSESSSLERFLKKREAPRGTDIVFVYGKESGRASDLEEAARVCVNLYNGRPGVHAGKAAVSQGGMS